MLIMGAIWMLSRQKHAVHPAECSLAHEWLSIQQNAVEGFYSLEYIEAVFSFTEEIIDNVKSVGCLLWKSPGCCLGRRMQSSKLSAL